MKEKKETGGLSNEDILQPGEQELDVNNLIDTVDSNNANFMDLPVGGRKGLLSKLQYSSGSGAYHMTEPSYGEIEKGEWNEYERLIDGPFSLLDSNVDDRRAEGQGLGEKVWNSYGVKLLPKIGTHVIGSTVGILDGFGEVAKDAYENGFAASNWNKFFNNDFQRSLDDYNKSLDEQFPIYYTSQERDLGFWQSTFGKGAANFWTDQFSQGLSFVAGAVLSEFATAGTAKFLMPAKAANNLKRISALRNTAYAQKSSSAIKQLNKISKADRIYDGLVTGRRLLTGAFYEAGVEARHNYDSVVENLTQLHLQEFGETPNQEDMARIKHTATMVSNSVFAGNAALVGYSNMLMFPKIFGRGMRPNKKFKNKFTKTENGLYKAKHQDWGRFKSFYQGAYALAKVPLYEGFVEEGGQKTLDLAGQYAAEDMYLAGKTPGQMETIGELVNHTFDGMAEAYGSTEGQKEIFLGFVLGALGLPSFIKTNEKGEKSFGIGYGKVGGVKSFWQEYQEGKKEVENLAKYMNENPDVAGAIKENFEMLNGISTAMDRRDYADASNNDFAYKNADHDAFFSFVYHRLRAGYYGDVLESLNEMRDMDIDSFEAMFNYEDDTQNMSSEDRKNFLTERRNKVIDSHIERAEKIKQVYDSLDETRLSDTAKKIYSQALSTTADLDAREQKIIEEVEEEGGFAIKAVVNKQENDQAANNNVLTRVKEFAMDKLGFKAKQVMEESEVGKEVKREIGVKEFTSPGHPQLVAHRMMQRLAKLKDQRDIYEENDQVDEYIEITEKIEKLENELGTLIDAINAETAPNISEEEKQFLEEFKQKDPANYELKKDDIIKKLQDLRRIRAKRHQMLNLIQRLVDPEAANDTIQGFEEMVQDILTEEERKKLPDSQQRLARKYKGKVIEFDYTNKQGQTNRHRVYVKDTTGEGLTRVPTEETFKLLERQKYLQDKKYKTEDEVAELELIAEELKRFKHVTNFKTFSFDILEQASNIKVMTEQELLLNRLEAVTSVLQEGLAEDLQKANTEITETKQSLVDLAFEIKTIKQAIQQAKNDTRGRTYVNLNRLGKRGAFKVETAQKMIADLKLKEKDYEKQLKQLTADLTTLEDNSLRIQIIHESLTNPESVSKLLGRATSQEDVLNFVNDLLGLTSNEEFYKNLGESGFFNTNELTAIIGQKNKDGGYDVDEQLLNEYLQMIADDNISKEYLDLMSSDLQNFKNELELLKEHRKDLERMLAKMINPNTNEVLMFPPDGLTKDDMVWLTNQLRLVDQDIKTLQSIINTMQAEVEQNAIESGTSDIITKRQAAIAIQREINNSLMLYQQWVTSTQIAPEDIADVEEGETATTVNAVENLKEQSRAYSPSLFEVGFTKTAGNHKAAKDKYEDKYQQLLEREEELTESEKMELQHIESQLRFFRKSYEVRDWTKKKGFKLLAVTRYNIRPEWKDQIVFYDIARAESSGKYGDPSNYKYADDLTENADRNETQEDIKLLLVDANLEPVMLDGGLVYTSMSSSSLQTIDGRDKTKPNDYKSPGLLKDEVLTAQTSFIAERDRILADSQERYFYIKNKSRGLPIEQVEGTTTKSPVMGRLKINKGGRNVVVSDESDLKNVRLEMAKPAAGVKGADQKVRLFNRFSVPSRFVYFGTASTGYNFTGNLVPGLISRLSENQVNNIYNLSRYFAEQGQEGGINIGGKGFTTILKDQIMYGSRSQERERQEFAIYMKDDTIFFGNTGQSITLEELKDPAQYETKHEAYKDFLRTLFFNVNSTQLRKDTKARQDAYKSSRKAGARFVEPEYTPFNEVIVNDDLSVDVIEYDNYTHYLISGRNRDEADIPVRVDIPLAFNTSKNVKQFEIPQFLNIYLEHDTVSMTAEQMKNDINNNTKTKPKSEGASIVVEKEEDKEKFVERKVLNEKTGEIRTILVKVATDEEAAQVEKDLQKGVSEEAPTEQVTEEDSLDGTPFTRTGEDEVFFLQSMSSNAIEQVDLNTELEWFNDNVPRDSKGNPLIGIDMIKGLIDGKAYGKFTKEGNILLSDMLTTEGVVYHESWHAITRRFIPEADRYAMYDEVRNMRGSTQTYKGESKRMSELTDKEADEWLAEEFREYVLSGGNYTVGANVKKSLLDKIFDKLYNILNFFFTTPSRAQQLMSKINTGYFADPTKDITVYDSKTEAYFEASEMSATLRNNAMEGMTVILFNKALKSNAFELADFVNPKKLDEVNRIISELYGNKSIDNSVYSAIRFNLAKAKNQAVTQEDKDTIQNTWDTIRNNWEQLKTEHAEYLKRFQVELEDPQALLEIEKVREQFGKPQNEIDPSVYLPKAVRILLGTLPSSRQLNSLNPNSPYVFETNSSGLPKLVDFGSIMNFLYKELANTDPLDFSKNLKELSKKRPEIRSLINRLGLETDDISDKTFDQMRLLVQTMMQFDQSNNTFFTQLMTRDNGRVLVNSNQNRIEDKIKFMWTSNFKDRIQNIKGLGKDVNGELLLNDGAKLKLRGMTKTFGGWATYARRTAEDSAKLLDRLGIVFSDTNLFAEMYADEYTGVSQAVDYILQAVEQNPVSDLFQGDIQQNLRTLINIEAVSNPTTVDLQHRNSEGKTVHGVNLKTYADTFVSKLNGANRDSELRALIQTDNLRNSYYLNRMLESNDNLEVVILEGIEQQFGKGKPLSKGGPVDIGVMYVNSVLNHGIVPLLRTADKKTEYGIKFGNDPTLMMSNVDMVKRLQGYLADELRTASKFNSKRNSKLRQIDKLKDAGGNLRFFEGIVPSIKREEYGRKLTEEQILEMVSRADVVTELRDYLQNAVTVTFETLKEYKITPAGIDKNLMNKAQGVAQQTGTKPQEVIAEQFTYEYLTGVIEQSKLFLGDLALYGNDLFKRTSGISGTKSYPTSNESVLRWMNSNMPNLLSNNDHSSNLRVSHRAAVNTEAPYLDQYISTLSALGAPLEFQDVVSRTYSNMEEFDGGGFITLDAYRSLLYRTGKWTPAQEEFYQKIANNELVLPKDMAIFPPLKPQLFGPFTLDNVRLMTYHKFALFPLIPGMLPGTMFDEINNDMVGNNIDYMIFESAVKVGGVTTNALGFDPFYQPLEEYNRYKPMELNSNGEVIGLQELSFSDLGIQLEIAPKTKDETTEGAQTRHLLPVNIYDQGVVSEEYKDLESRIDRFHEIHDTLLTKDFNSLVKKLKLEKDETGNYRLKSNDVQEFKDLLINEFKKRDNPLHTIESIKSLLDSDTKFIEQLFEKNKIESLLYSLVNNNVLRRKMPGGQYVLQASTGFETELKAITQEDFDAARRDKKDLHDLGLKPLKFYRKQDPDNPNSKTLAMQVYLPSKYKDAFGERIDNISEVDPELLQLIGFRIPTEGLNSIDFIEVAGFLPPAYGDTVVVPSEIVGKAGSDYDIDKLSIYFPNAYRDGDSVKRIKFDPEKSTKQQSRKALQNEMQNIIKEVLEHPKSFDQLITPVGAYTIKKLAREVAMLRNPANFDATGEKIKLPLSQMFLLGNMINNSHRLFSGLGGIGIVATSSTQHAKGQRVGLDWNFEAHDDINFRFEGRENFSLSRVRDVNNNHKISAIIGEYVTGYVDVTKEDFIFDINAGLEYAPIHMLLIRSGVPVESVIYFMSQPIIDEYIKRKYLTNPMYSPFPLKTEDRLVNEIIKDFGQMSSNAELSAPLLKGMIGKNVNNLNKLEKQVQVQVLKDFIRYKTLAEDLLLLKDSTSTDTAEVKDSMSVRYALQGINRLQQDGRFVNLDELLFGNREGASTVAAYNKILEQTDGLFSEFKLGEYITDAKRFIDEKLFEATDKNAKVNRDDLLYKMKKFENFLAATVVQNTEIDYKKLSERAQSLFTGENSLPRRINALKKANLYRDNLLIQQLTPVLQVYTEESEKATVDGLRLFSKKLQPYDVDLLADAFMELKETNPELAKELIIFSALQSGYDFNPNSFFQAIPGTEVLEVLSKYFKNNKKEDRTSNLINSANMSNLYTDFHKNNYQDSRVVRNVFRKSIETSKQTGQLTIILKSNDEFVSVTTPTGQSSIGNRAITTYETNLFKASKKLNDGTTLYYSIPTKGVRNNLLEATGANTPSIVNLNVKSTAKGNMVDDPNTFNNVLNLSTNTGKEVDDVIEKEKCKKPKK